MFSREQGPMRRLACLVLLCGLALGAGWNMAEGTEPGLSRERDDSGTADPEWDELSLRRCQSWCSFEVTNPALYNYCYACRCLIAAAETEGEFESALAQCEVARDDLKKR